MGAGAHKMNTRVVTLPSLIAWLMDERDACYEHAIESPNHEEQLKATARCQILNTLLNDLYRANEGKHPCRIRILHHKPSCPCPTNPPAPREKPPRASVSPSDKYDIGLTTAHCSPSIPHAHPCQSATRATDGARSIAGASWCAATPPMQPTPR